MGERSLRIPRIPSGVVGWGDVGWKPNLVAEPGQNNNVYFGIFLLVKIWFRLGIDILHCICHMNLLYTVYLATNIDFVK